MRAAIVSMTTVPRIVMGATFTVVLTTFARIEHEGRDTFLQRWGPPINLQDGIRGTQSR